MRSNINLRIIILYRRRRSLDESMGITKCIGPTTPIFNNYFFLQTLTQGKQVHFSFHEVLKEKNNFNFPMGNYAFQKKRKKKIWR